MALVKRARIEPSSIKNLPEELLLEISHFCYSDDTDNFWEALVVWKIPFYVKQENEWLSPAPHVAKCIFDRQMTLLLCGEFMNLAHSKLECYMDTVSIMHTARACRDIAIETVKTQAKSNSFQGETARSRYNELMIYSSSKRNDVTFALAPKKIA